VGTEPVLEGIVVIHLLNRKGRVRVTRPAPAPVEILIDSSDPVLPRQTQGDGIIFSITDIGKADFPEQLCLKSPWCAQAIDPQGVISAIGVRPFPVIDQAWRNFLQPFIDEGIEPITIP